MEQLVYWKLHSLNLLKKAKTELTRMGGLLDNKYGDEKTNSFHFGVALGKPEPKTALGGCLAFNNEEATKCFEKHSKGLDVTADDVVMVFSFKAIDGEKAKEELEEKIEEIKVLACAMIPPAEDFLNETEFTYAVADGRINLGIQCKIQMIIDLINEYSGMADAVLKGEFSFVGTGKAETDVTIGSLLESTLGNIGYQFDCNLDLKIAGYVLKNLVGDFLNKYDPEKQRFRFDHFAQCLGFLLKGAKF